MSYFRYHTSATNSFSDKLVSLLGKPRNPFIPLHPEDDGFQYYADIARGAQNAVINILCKIFDHATHLQVVSDFSFEAFR